MTPFKKTLRNDTVRRVLCWLGAQYIRLAHATGRWTVVGGETPRRFWDAGKPFILCFWHGRLLMMPYCWDRRRPISVLISQHPDGQILARTVGHFGIDTVAGSTTRGGTAALRTLLKTLKAGAYVGITPDGPRGPRAAAEAEGGLAEGEATMSPWARSMKREIAVPWAIGGARTGWGSFSARSVPAGTRSHSNRARR